MKYDYRGDWTLGLIRGLTGQTWNGEDNLLPAFADLGVAEKAGFKNALRCLFSPCCFFCGVRSTLN